MMFLKAFQKYIRTIALSLVPILFLSAAGVLFSSTLSLAAEKKVLTTFFPLYIHALNIAGDKAKIDVLLQPGMGIHDFKPKPSDMKKVASADIIIVNGAGLDDFVKSLIESSGNTAAKVIDSSKTINLICGTATCGHDHENEPHSHGEISDPHTWASVKNAIIQVKNITDAFIDSDKENSSFYLKNSQEYIKKLEEIDKMASEKLAEFKGRKFITYHGPFSYFAKDYGLIQSSIADMTGNAPAPSKLKETYDSIKKENIRFIVSEPAYQDRETKTITEELKLQVVELDPIESYNQSLEIKSYFTDKMKENIEKIAAAFKLK
ncbi:MAG TPA: zinc ABC transporter substrate-binding protein [Candidatus Wallbacteria bacterium]|nr:zinc ABC transporter substrate-binding protein [Candidatus Wallbacteria bacterium]